ncbi:hypothetical protein BTE77_35395 [Ensifer adhaerens]|nr:hypothetical protein BTE77_35395 [Ensifer adhaerens]
MKRPKSAKAKNAPATWQPTDGLVNAEFKGAGKGFSLALKARDGRKFGQFISENLDRLYGEFRQSEMGKGD